VDSEGKRQFWGLISAVIDVERLFQVSGLLDADLSIDVALRGKDGKGAQGEVFFGDAALFAADAERLTVPLPHGSWQMAARPKGGWSSRPDNAWIIRLGFAIAALLIIGPMLLLVRFDLRQRLAERRLVASEERLSLAIGAAQLVAWDWDLASGQLHGNPAMSEVLGLPAGFIEPSIDALKARIHPGDIARVDAAIEAHLHDQSPLLEVDFRLRGGGDAWRWCRSVGKIVGRDVAGRPERVSGVLQDITALKAALDDLENARAEAEAGSRAKSEFLATMSHEIRTPMNGVLGMADLLLTTPLDAEQKGFVDALRKSGHSLLAIINDILDFSKIEAGRLTLETVDFNLAELAGEVCDLLRSRTDEKGLLLTLACPDDLPACLRGDALRIRQVLVNLVSNAIKFTQAGRIDVEVSWRAGQSGQALVRFAVRDTGIGIAPEAQELLFVYFSQLEASTTRRFGGTGLGLAISRRLVEAMQGRIGVVSAPDEGACFWFELPLDIGSGVPAAAGAEKSVATGGPGIDLAPPKVGAGETAPDFAADAVLPVFDARGLDVLIHATGMSSGELIAMLLADIERMAGEMLTAGAGQQPDEMRRLMHSIKSLSSQLGALKLAALAGAMEHAVRNNQIDACIARLPDLQQAIDEVAVAVKGLLPV
jgi:hypothetical protein